MKQLLPFWTAGELLGEQRRDWLREPDPARLLERLRAPLDPGLRSGRELPSTVAARGVRVLE